VQYLSYTQVHPLKYRLMFGPTWPQSAKALDLVSDATHAFDVLRGVLRRMHRDSAAMREAVELDALYIWSTVHGLAGVTNGQCVDKLGLKTGVIKRAVQHAMGRMEIGLYGKK
jgi:hypothetical protein